MTQKFMLAALAICTICHGDQIDVPANGDIQAAIDAASNGDVIQLAAWSYEVENTLNTQGKSITIRGTLDPSGLHLTTLDGDKERTILVVNSGETSETILQDISFEDGKSNGGGGIEFVGSSATINNCVFSECVNPLVVSSTGGAVLIRSGSSPTFVGCRFEENESGLGGACYISNSVAYFESCSFLDNIASSSGGAIRTWDSSELHIHSCTFTGNISDSSGGAISHGDNSMLLISESELSGNEDLQGGGGGIRILNGSSMNAESCRIENNQGNGVYVTSDEPISIEDCNIQNNQPVNFKCTGSCDLDLSSSLPGDMDGDGDIDEDDLTILGSIVGVEDNQCPSDINGDGAVNFSDLLNVISDWGACP